jgi:polyisoprenoid-binding protein YceI
MTTTEIERKPAATTRWIVDRDGSAVEFTVKILWGLGSVHGRFDRFDGWYELRPDGTNRIELAIEAASVDTGNRSRDRHLRASDFFDADEHPRVRFTSTRVRDASDGTLHVEGSLEAAGEVVPLEFDAAVQQVDRGLRAEATTTVDPRRFGMKSGRFGYAPPATLHVKVRLSEPTVAAG